MHTHIAKICIYKQQLFSSINIINYFAECLMDRLGINYLSQLFELMTIHVNTGKRLSTIHSAGIYYLLYYAFFVYNVISILPSSHYIIYIYVYVGSLCVSLTYHYDYDFRTSSLILLKKNMIKSYFI